MPNLPTVTIDTSGFASSSTVSLADIIKISGPLDPSIDYIGIQLFNNPNDGVSVSGGYIASGDTGYHEFEYFGYLPTHFSGSDYPYSGGSVTITGSPPDIFELDVFVVYTLPDGTLWQQPLFDAKDLSFAPPGVLFTQNADYVDFNNLTSDQFSSINGNPSSIYSALDGNDTVYLPNVANYR